MADIEKVIKGLNDIGGFVAERIGIEQARNFTRTIDDACAMLKKQDDLLRKLQKDKDKLCLEISEWKHKFHDAPPKFVSQGVVDQIRWERDTALSQLEQIGKGFGSKMDDIVALLKEQKAVKPITKHKLFLCPVCKNTLFREQKFCHECGKHIEWEGR